MGFLNHGTTNIIVDAVLTDKGREMLAKNDGSFQVSQFALGDDEVDYSIIEKFGRTIGKEKIEKNTPVLEASTAASLGLKWKLVSISNEFLTHLPVMEYTIAGSSSILALSRSISSKSIQLTLSTRNGESIDQDLIDSEFLVEMNHLFLSLSGESPDYVHSDNIASYRYTANFSDISDTVTSTIPISLKSFSDTTFSLYAGSQAYVRTYIKISGINSGLTKTVEVQISK